jgi:undecaprenyl-diphosphatase
VDIAVTYFLTGWAHRLDIVDVLVIFFASYSQYVLVAGTMLFSMLPNVRTANKFLALTALASAMFSRFVLAEMVRSFYSYPRPFVSLDIDPLIVVRESLYQYSFPSGHASFFFAFATTVFLAYRKPGAWLYLGAVVMGIARVAAGVHWISDILGGAFVGIFGGLVFDYLRGLISEWIIRRK